MGMGSLESVVKASSVGYLFVESKGN